MTDAIRPPYSYSKPDEASLALIDIVPHSGIVTVDLLSADNPLAINQWDWSDPDNPLVGGEIEVDLENSLPIVTIRVGQEDVIPEPLTMVGVLCAGRGHSD